MLDSFLCTWCRQPAVWRVVWTRWPLPPHSRVVHACAAHQGSASKSLEVTAVQPDRAALVEIAREIREVVGLPADGRGP